MQGHAAVRTGVAQGERTAGTVASYDEWYLKQHGLVELIAVNLAGGQGAIPEARKHERVSRLPLRRVEFGHECGNRRLLIVD